MPATASYVWSFVRPSKPVDAARGVGMCVEGLGVHAGRRRTTQEDGRTVAIKKVEIFDMAVKKRERCLQVRGQHRGGGLRAPLAHT